MHPNQKPTERRDKMVVIVIAVVLAVAALGLLINIGIQWWSYTHQQPQQETM